MLVIHLDKSDRSLPTEIDRLEAREREVRRRLAEQTETTEVDRLSQELEALQDVLYAIAA